jgi:hypothetical protein
VYFLIEGTQEMSQYRIPIINALSSVWKNLPDDLEMNYGAAIYRDAINKTNNQDFELKKLSGNRQAIIDFVNEQNFVTFADDVDPWTNLRAALYKLLVRGEMNPEAMNLIIVVGSNADFSFNKARLLTAKEEDKIIGEKLENLEEMINQNQVNLAFLQIKNEEGKSYSKFADDARSFIVNTVQKQEAFQNQVAGDKKKDDVFIPDLTDESTEMTVQGTVYGYIRRPLSGNILTQSDLYEGMEKSIVETTKRLIGTYEYLKSIVSEGGSLEDIPDAYAPIIWDILAREIDARKLRLESIEKLKSERVKLYSDIYIPKTIPGLPKPYKTVVFMPGPELDDYIDQLKEMERTLNMPSDQQRRALYDVFVELMKKISGDNNLTLSEINKTSLDYLRRKLNGLELEGLQLSDQIGFNIEDVTNKKVLPDSDLQSLGERIRTRLKELKRIRDLRDKYEFSYTYSDRGDDSVYYWISTELLF